jgi:hypothetical protein
VPTILSLYWVLNFHHFDEFCSTKEPILKGKIQYAVYLPVKTACFCNKANMYI